MSQHAGLTAVLFLICSLALPAWGQQYFLYEPKPVKAEEKDQAKNGVLVTEVTVKKGDTLKEISRNLNGRDSYFPQILLFNKINNADKIQVGDTIRVPVSQGGAGTDSATSKKSSGKSKKLVKRKKNSAQGSSRYRYNGAIIPGNVRVDQVPAGQGDARYRSRGAAVPGESRFGQTTAGDPYAGQKLFERAINAYKQDDFGTALELFDRYLQENSNSPLAADASLYKAECYLKLSSR
jgi:TolA-binding protein